MLPSQRRWLPQSIRGLVLSVALLSTLVTLVLGAATILVVHWELERQLDQRIELETRALLAHYRENGFDALAHAIALRDHQSARDDIGYLAGMDGSGRSTAYLLVDAAGRRRAGSFAAIAPPPPGWSEFVRFQRPDGSIGDAQAMNSRLAGGGQLVVAADRTVIYRMHRLLLKVFAVGFGVLLLLNLGVMIGFGRVIRHRLTAIEVSADAIMAGDLRRRMPVGQSGSEFDRLSEVLNRMLDRMNLVLDNLRQASGDIAHDLRTPLQRVRGNLEQAIALTDDPRTRAKLDETMAGIEDALTLFSALLAISEVEGQSVRARFRPLDLGRAVDDLVAIYQPAIEDSGRTLRLDCRPVWVSGDRMLLQQAIGNLLDNALLHTPVRTAIRVRVEQTGDTAVIRVQDDGPGIPASQRQRVFQRLVRLDASRSAPGHGLGLSMVRAIARAHGGSATIEPADQGLSVRIELPAVAADSQADAGPCVGAPAA